MSGRPIEFKRYRRKAEPDSKRPAADYDFSDDKIASEFAHTNRERLRFCPQLGGYLFFDGVRWQADRLRAEALARELLSCQSATARGLGLPKKALERLGSYQKTQAVAAMARNDDRLRAKPEEFDADDYIANTPGGIVDLRTGEIGPNRPEAMCTQATAVASAPEGTPCPLWQKLIKRALGDEPTELRYLQRLAGYALTGDVSEHVLSYWHGGGGNGKGTILNTLAAILGSYAADAPMETFTANSQGQIPTDLAGLVGKRLVISTETERGRRWAESRIKMMTGGDRVTARFMRQDFFTYSPKFKIIISGNHKPRLGGVDESVRRRFHWLPFDVTIPEDERDPELKEKLKPEWPAILRWAIEGCLDWQENRLPKSKKVAAATDAYLTAQDTLAQWIDDCAALDANGWALSGALFASWRAWAEARGEFAGSARTFADALQGIGCRPDRRHQGRGFAGISLAPDHSAGNGDI